MKTSQSIKRAALQQVVGGQLGHGDLGVKMGAANPQPYKSVVEKSHLVDALANMTYTTSDGSRKVPFGEWQAHINYILSYFKNFRD